MGYAKSITHETSVSESIINSINTFFIYHKLRYFFGIKIRFYCTCKEYFLSTSSYVHVIIHFCSVFQNSGDNARPPNSIRLNSTRCKVTNNNPKEIMPSKKDFDTQKKNQIYYRKKVPIKNFFISLQQFYNM